MATVFADSPSAAFAASSNLDQQRVANYLNSIAANRRSQLEGYQAAAHQAALQQSQQLQQQGQMTELLKSVIRQKQDQANLGFGQQDLAERIRHNKFLETAPNAAADTLAFNKANQTKADAERATLAESVARYLNEKSVMEQLTKRLPTADAAKSADSGWGWGTRDANRTTGRAKFSGELADLFPMDILQQADFTTAKTPVDLRAAIEKVLTDRTGALTGMIPKSEVDLNSLVKLQDGRYVPIPANPLLGGGAPAAVPRVAPAPAPAVTSAPASAEGIREDFRNGRIDRATAVQALKALGFK